MKPSSWLPESPMNTAGSPPGAQVVRQEARAGKAEGEGEGQDELVLVERGGVDREVPAGDGGERRRQAVHVVESRLNALVIPTSQTTATIVASRSFPISSTCRPAAIAMPAAANCATSFASGLRCRTSSTSPAAKERSAGEDSRELAARLERPCATAVATPASRPRKMPTPPKVGVLRSCQRSPVGWATRCSASEGSAGGGEGRARQPAGRRSSRPRSQPWKGRAGVRVSRRLGCLHCRR